MYSPTVAADSNITCRMCPPEQYAPAASAICEVCPAHSAALAHSGLITDCLCNTGFTGPDGGPCVACPAGTHKDSNGSADCTNCSVGMYSPTVAADSNITCRMCPPEQYAPAASAICEVCPAHSAALAHSGLITDCLCNTGFTGRDGGPCVVCPADTYKASNGSANCTDCPINSNSSAGSQNITDCICDVWCAGPDGGPCIPRNSTFNVTSGVDQCSPGFTGPDSTGPCLACALGKYKNVVGPDACASCLAGQFQAQLAATDCSTCAQDTFSNVSGEAVCTACPAGFRALAGTTTVQDCCGNNSRPQIGTCTNITQIFSSTENNSIAQNITQNFSSTENNSIAQSITQDCSSTILCSCNTGYTGPDTGASKGQCSACPPGTYKPTNGTANCTSCPLNSNSSVGSQNITDCFCDAWCSGPPGGPCIPKNSTLNVSSGVYQCSPGNTGPDRTGPCLACAVGTSKDVPGSAACTLCPPGQYQTETGSRSCVACPPDTFQNATGSIGCQTCPAGFKALPGTTAVQDCCGLNSSPQQITTCTVTNQDPLSSILATSPAYLIASAQAWDAPNSRFTDLSGNGRHGVLNWGAVSVGSVAGNGAVLPLPFAQGAQSTAISWPPASIPWYFTICSITRYSGGAKSRILQCSDYDWLHGHINWYGTGYAGGTWYNYNAPAGSWFGQVIPNTDWVAMCGRNIGGAPATITNGVQVSENNRGRGDCQLTINRPESSDWQFSKLYVWNGHLSTTEFAEAAKRLNSYVKGELKNCVASITCPCNTGYTGPDAGVSKGQCAMCAAGTYKPTNGSAACTSCPADSNSPVNSMILSSCSCNSGYTGPNGGPCPACAAGKFKNASGTATCVTCPENTHSPSGVSSCTSCPVGFKSPNGSTLFSDCCDPNTTYAKNVYDALSSATKTALDPSASRAAFVVRVSSVPELRYYASQPNPPSYISSGGYNGKAFLRFSKVSSTSGHNYLSVPTSHFNGGSIGNTVVIVIRFMENIKGVFYGMQTGTPSNFFELYLSETLQFCVNSKFQSWMSCCTCTDTAVPINVWLQVSYTDNPSAWPRQTLKVTYMSTSGTAIVLEKTTGDPGTWGMNDGYKTAIGYSPGCAGQSSSMQMNGACDRPNFDLAGFYLIQTAASNADIAVLFEAIAIGTQILYDKGSTCQCNAGFEGSGRSNCASCAPGTFKSEIRSASCSLCVANTYSTAVQAIKVSTCLACPNNSVSVPGRFECECNFGYEGDMFSCSACVPGKYKRFLGTSACLDCPANTEAPGFATKFCESVVGYNGLGYALDDVGRSCGASLTGTCSTLSNGAVSIGTAFDGALDASTSTFVSVTFNQNLARLCGNTGTAACVSSSAVLLSGSADLAIDGSTSSQMQTNNEAASAVRPWWRVDFGRDRSVFAVNVMSTNWAYTKDFKIVVGNVPDAQSSLNAVCADYLVGNGAAYVKFNCEDVVSGRYLYIINGPHASNFLTLSEVVVEAFNYIATPSLMLPWWAVDFEVERAVAGLVIRTQAANVVQVRVGHSSDPLQNAVCAQNTTLLTTGNNNITCPSAMLGRYLFVIGKDNTVLVLNDVRVLGFPTAQCAAGTYKPLVENSNCTACPAFSTSVVGATSIAQCSCRAGYLDVWS